jgi:plasmid maintenance system antidote protein VapI
MVDRYKTTKAIKDWEIRKSDLAQLADVLPCRVSDYCSGKRVPPSIASRIEEAVAKVVKVWSVLPVRTDISDQASFAKALEIADTAIAKIDAEDAASAPQNMTPNVEIA